MSMSVLMVAKTESVSDQTTANAKLVGLVQIAVYRGNAEANGSIMPLTECVSVMTDGGGYSANIFNVVVWIAMVTEYVIMALASAISAGMKTLTAQINGVIAASMASVMAVSANAQMDGS